MSEEAKNMKHCRRLDRSPEKLSPHLTHENKVVIANLRQSTENIRNYFDKLNNDLQDQSKALDEEKTLRKNAEEKLRSHFINMYQNKSVNTELRSRLPRANKSDPFESVNSDKKDVDVQTNSAEHCLSLESSSISGKYKGKARKRNRRKRRLDFEYPYDKSCQRGDKCNSSDTSEDEINNGKDQKPARCLYNSDVHRDHQQYCSLSQYQQSQNPPEERNGGKQSHSMMQNEIPRLQFISKHEEELYTSYPQHLSPHQSTVKFNTTLPFHTDTNFPLQSVPIAQSTPFNTHLSSYDSGFMPSYGAVLSTNTSLASLQKPKFADSLMHNSNHVAKEVISPEESNHSGGFAPKDSKYVTAQSSSVGTLGNQTPSSVPFSSFTCKDNSPASFHTALFEINSPLGKSFDLPPTTPPANSNEQNADKVSYEQNEEANAVPLNDEQDDINLLKMQLKTKTMELEYYQNKTKCSEEIDLTLKNCLDLLQKRHDDDKRSKHTSYDGLEMVESDSCYSDISDEFLKNSKINFLSFKEAVEENEQFLQLYKKKEKTKQRITDVEMQVMKSQRDFAVKKMKSLSQEVLQFKTKRKDSLDEETKMYISSVQAKLDIYQSENEKLVQENEALKKKVALLQDEGGMWISKFENKFDDLRIDHSIAKYVTGNSIDIDDREDTRMSSPSKSPKEQQPLQQQLKGSSARSLSSSQLPSTIDEDQVHKLMVKLSMAYRIQDQQQKKIDALNKIVAAVTTKDSDVEKPLRDKE